MSSAAFPTKYDLAVFVISSLNRESYREEQRSLRMDSFKETGGIEYSARRDPGTSAKKYPTAQI